ncbi:hypothetical protein B0H19DRAFT_1166757 [Mycena capillaripes]|nr:hypothetical protein B0H19DRAFT_1166757 [Mycena capillaripes]
MSSCLVCHEDYADRVENYLVTCHQCRRSWHHRCREPPIPDSVVIQMWSDFLESTRQVKPKWTCTKCSRRKQVPEIIDISEPAPVTPPRPTVAKVAIDLSDSPEVVALELSDPTPDLLLHHPVAELPPSRSVAAKVDIDLTLDSPESVALELPEPPTADLLLPHLAVKLPEFPVVVDLPSMDVEASRSSASSGQPSASESPSLSELALPDTPTGRSTPTTIVRFPSMDVDDIEQKPLHLLLHKLTVTERPQGGTLGPAWMRERYEASDQMANWKQFLEKQKISKPLSRRKPAQTRFIGPFHKPFLVLPL